MSDRTIICNKNFHFIELCNSINTIGTIPELMNNEFAYGFDNLTFKARFNKMNYTDCGWVVEWKHYEENEFNFVVIFNSLAQCNDAAPCYEEDVYDAIYINTELTISKPITYDPRISIICNRFSQILSWNGFSKSRLITFQLKKTKTI